MWPTSPLRSRGSWNWRRVLASVSAPPSLVTMVTVVTIDGPTSSGKGTISRMVALRLHWHLLDSGALYRLVALAGTQLGLEPDNIPGHAAVARELDVRFGAVDDQEQVWLGGRDVTAKIRTAEAGMGASRVAAWPAV